MASAVVGACLARCDVDSGVVASLMLPDRELAVELDRVLDGVDDVTDRDTLDNEGATTTGAPLPLPGLPPPVIQLNMTLGSELQEMLEDKATRTRRVRMRHRVQWSRHDRAHTPRRSMEAHTHSESLSTLTCTCSSLNERRMNEGRRRRGHLEESALTNSDANVKHPTCTWTQRQE
jgi:hypothetical protein